MREKDEGRIAGPLRTIVAIPARNERDRIVACLRALDRQRGLPPHTFGILLLLNNCDDETAAVVAAHAAEIAAPLRVIETTFAQASAGWARRQAMEAASAWLDEAGLSDAVLLTTDADTIVPPDWVALNLAAIAAGADAVAGRISLDPDEARLLPSELHARGRLEADYEALLTEIGARLRPEPGNPWPCHWSKSGATLAARADVYRAVGGMPDLACGEDRAFVDAIRTAGFAVRHAPEIEVVTSGRLEGRAQGGVADTIRARIVDPDAVCDDRLESLPRFLLRLYVPLASLPWRPLRPSQLPRQITRARHLSRLLRWWDHRRSAARRADSRRFVSETPVAQIPPTAP